MLVQQALVGSASGEEQLFSSESSLTRDGIACELDVYLEKIKVCNFLFFRIWLPILAVPANGYARRWPTKQNWDRKFGWDILLEDENGQRNKTGIGDLGGTY
ncbi:hypothetical protein L195_g025938 [Trifolium pratense]|uniref:Uncharacterized protein n=2 Tax=Trifolium TaxID=3898 RepID=A0A2K3NHV6_TRIPR|nr:hypothetical protein L195_g025938 [Trifolium pratense]